MVFYCERAADFAADSGLDDAAYYSALVRMFAQALEVTDDLPAERLEPLHARLDTVCELGLRLGVGFELEALLSDYRR